MASRYDEKFNSIVSILSYNSPNSDYKYSECITINDAQIFYNFDTIEDKEEIMYEFLSEINNRNNYSYAFLQEQLNLFFLNNSSHQENNTYLFFDKWIKEIPLKKYFVYTGLYGVYTDEKVKLGKFHIVDKKEMTSYLSNYNRLFVGNELTEVQIETFAFNEISASCFIGIEIETYDDDRACEIARAEFGNFEKLICFCCIRNAGRPPVKIFNLVNRATSFLLLQKDSWKNNSSANPLYVGAFNYRMKTLLDEMKENNTLTLFDLYTNEHNSDFKKRIINAVLWIGQANAEEDINVKLLEYCFAMESILQKNQSSILSPSITYQISRACAIIIGDTYEERKKVIRNFEIIYSMRSAIAHGGNKLVPEYYTNLSWQYLVKLILKLTRDAQWKGIDSIQSLWNKVEEIMLTV